MRILDLFSGTHSVPKACAQREGWSCVTVDLADSDYNVDVLEWDYTKDLKPREFDVVWASPPCRYFSKLRESNIGRGGMTKKSVKEDLETKGLPLLRRAMEIIAYLQPKKFIVENPDTGRMKEYMTALPHYVVDYCAYSDWGYRKRTRLWTDIEGFVPKTCAGKESCPNMERNPSSGRWRHVLATDAGGRGRKGTTRRLRYRVPPAMILELLDLC
ncbi:cytosine DNA methyltransferase [Bohle iridovirus]|uniref:Cytosine DNA methyltransferase n=3 Tax=Frog virus 3 TaxID=10493 RepID=A0A3Q8UGT8_FRG3V|nr:cytosine DNA methyltransferase [Bohle iridovirus]AJR29219.1 putative cytosine DNA methyltransferase [German gecko ranavirus]ANK58011.1 cytosine DNA methyltransferase [Bohle iridovirus]AZM32649.1 cytosine DNA methyltransferase [Zoo ranavirus]